MSKLIRDLFQTQQPDLSYKWDMTNVAWSAIPWLFSAMSYTGLGIYQAVAHPGDFSLVNFAAGAGSIFALGGIGVMFHSRSQV